MGIFGLKSWDPPPPLPPHLVSGLVPRVFSEQDAVSVRSEEAPNACQNYTGVHQLTATSSDYLPGAHAAVTEKNPFWSGSAGTQALPVEEHRTPLCAEKVRETHVNRSEAIGSQSQNVMNRDVQLNNCSSKTEFDEDAMKLIHCGRGSQFKSSSGTVGSTSRPIVVGSGFQTGENPAEMVTRQNPGFLSGGGQRGNAGSGFSGHDGKVPVVGHASRAVRIAQEPLTPEAKGLHEQGVDHVTSCLNPASPEFVPKVNPLVAKRVGCRLIAKYKYEANPDSPLGANSELSLRRMEQLEKIGCHPEHAIWWLARNENGEEGYIPSSYVMVLEEKCGLPWLQNRAPEEEASPLTTQSGVIPRNLGGCNEFLGRSPNCFKEIIAAKPYKSAYDKSTTSLSSSNQYNCEPCGKSFNGPQPYRAHMSSRAHRETLETMD